MVAQSILEELDYQNWYCRKRNNNTSNLTSEKRLCQYSLGQQKINHINPRLEND